jgi:hypothetical protein
MLAGITKTTNDEKDIPKREVAPCSASVEQERYLVEVPAVELIV